MQNRDEGYLHCGYSDGFLLLVGRSHIDNALSHAETDRSPTKRLIRSAVISVSAVQASDAV